MNDSSKPLKTANPATAPAPAGSSAIDAFLGSAKRLAPVADSDPRGRLVFALDATMSRQPTWDLACRLQADMFGATASLAGLAVQLVYFRGFDECRSSRWVADAAALTSLMGRIDCRGGQTQIARVLRHVRTEAGRTPVRALVYVGDAMEEPVDELCAVAGELGLLGVKAFMFHEGADADAGRAFREIARLTGGAYAHFDAGAAGRLAGLLRAAAAYASGGTVALHRLASREGEARRLLTAMPGGGR
ncbi:VWA domain-containing protein [Salinarimonas soli]|nr:VWA domain-containing protein [Salinarimonas soli]